MMSAAMPFAALETKFFLLMTPKEKNLGFGAPSQCVFDIPYR